MIAVPGLHEEMAIRYSAKSATVATNA